MEQVHVLIADDHPVVRDGLRLLLNSVPDMAVVGEAASGEEAVALAASVQPDVILMDLKMPGLNGIEAIRRLRAELPQVQVLALSVHDEDRLVLSVNAPDSGAAEEELAVAYGDERLEIGFNAKYLLEIASQVDRENAVFLFNSSGDPALMREGNDTSAIYVVMPMRV